MFNYYLRIILVKISTREKKLSRSYIHVDRIGFPFLLDSHFCYKPRKIRPVRFTRGASIDVAFMSVFAIRLADSNGSTNPFSPVRPKARACWIARACLSCLSLFIGIVVSLIIITPVLSNEPGVTGGCCETCHNSYHHFTTVPILPPSNVLYFLDKWAGL